ncbi:uncharacterized protein LOC133184000 [Saccostrea echinata]|uniref:uncharacterized protein LOC133184000 n=1 Tax=Saccostrea echinata TaxID=191078 RepID=UPI002A82E65C|nr:uncharacterized protein LOC133184000 [Saccostrea echinata]
MADHVYVKIDIRCIDAAIRQSKFVKAKLDDDIGRVISVLLEESGKSDAVQISRIESRGTDIDPKTPISVLKDFGCKTISAWVCKLEQDSNTTNNKPTQGKSIFDVLMTATRSYTQYPAQR